MRPTFSLTLALPIRFDKRQAPLQKMAFKYDVEVQEKERVELNVPLPPGARVTVFVIEESGERFHDLLSAAQSSLDFWDNPLDDEDWNIDGQGASYEAAFSR